MELRHRVHVHLPNKLLNVSVQFSGLGQLEGTFLDKVNAVWLVSCLEDCPSSFKVYQLYVVEQVLQLRLAHRLEDPERLEELDAALEVSLDGLLHDASVRLPVDAGDFTGLHAQVGTQVGLRLDESRLAKVLARAQLAHPPDHPDILCVGLI